MESFANWLVDHLVLIVLVLTRLSLLIVAIPAIFGGVPKRVLVFLSMTMTILIVPGLSSTIRIQDLPQSDHALAIAIAVAQEALIGLFMGSMIQLIVTGLQLGGEIIVGTGGMQLGDAVDPTTQSSMPVLARFIGMLVTAVMLAVGGHRMLMASLLDSFQVLPPGKVSLDESLLALVLDQLAVGATAGIRLSAPVVAGLLLSNVLTGLISRTLPQLNVLAIGLNVNALVLLVLCAISLGTAGLIFQDELRRSVDSLNDYLSR
jgi:flagellar biosynthetic protein FliR